MKILRNIGFLLISILAAGHIQGQTGSESTTPKPDVKKDIIGSWKSDEAIVQFVNGKVVIINKQKYAYVIVGKTIVVGNDDGQVQMPFVLAGDKLAVLF